MIGSDGPGDKLFRLVTDTTPLPAHLSSADLLSHAPIYEPSRLPPTPGGLSGLAPGLSPHQSFSLGEISPPSVSSNDVWGSPELPIFGRFRNFSRDEGSQLDKVSFVSHCITPAAMICNCMVEL